LTIFAITDIIEKWSSFPKEVGCMPETKIPKDEARVGHESIMVAVRILADFSEDYGHPKLRDVFDADDFDVQSIADVLDSLREHEMSMIAGTAKQIYPEWCKAFGLRAKEFTSQDELLGAIQMLARALENSLKGLPVRNGPHCFAAAETLTAGTEYEFQRNFNS
jgi:hypothetical protein